MLATENGCSVRFVQRDYTAGSSPRIESVWLAVTGMAPGSDPCATATALATAAARKLPPPS